MGKSTRAPYMNCVNNVPGFKHEQRLLVAEYYRLNPKLLPQGEKQRNSGGKGGKRPPFNARKK